MKTVDFYPKTFHQIPDQDNPAFGNDECLMVVREFDKDRESDRSAILHIKPDPIESVNRVAVVWNHDVAINFCENFKG